MGLTAVVVSEFLIRCQRSVFVKIYFDCLNGYYHILPIITEIALLGTAVFTSWAAAEQCLPRTDKWHELYY